MTDTPRTTPAFALKPGWLAEDINRAAERVAQGFPTAHEKRLEAALQEQVDECRDPRCEMCARHQAILDRK